MQFKDSLEIVLAECRFVPGVADLSRLIPEAQSFLPPLSALRFSDGGTPRFSWGFPVAHSRRLVGHCYALFAQLASRLLEDPTYQEKLQNLTPDQLKADPYFRIVSDLLTRTLAEGAFLKLDSVLWIYVLDVLGRRLGFDDELDAFLQAALPDDHEQLTRADHPLRRLQYRDPERFAEIRAQLLRSFFARHEYALSCMKEIFDEIPRASLSGALVAHRWVFTEAPGSLYDALDLADAFRIKPYRHSIDDFQALNELVRLVIAGILRRRAAGRLMPSDTFFLKTVDLEVAYAKAADRSRGGIGGLQMEEVDRVALFLSLQEAPVRYLLFHMGDFAKTWLKPIEKQVDLTRGCIRSLRTAVDAAETEAAYAEITADVLRWDFFNALRARLALASVDDEGAKVGGRPLEASTVPLNLDAYHEVYRRSRHGTAVFFDLVGFTARTKALAKRPEAQPAQRGEERSRFSFMSLAIQRLFSVRQHLDRYGGIPQGFEGDAILDVFPRALDALRYVSLFAENYERNRTLRYRPFERPAPSPYQDGWRVGLASGDYTVISIVGRSNEMAVDSVQERAVGHTINRASRLNSGKKGDQMFLLDAPEGGGAGLHHDPLEVLKVRVDPRRQLSNDGICSFEDTFLEIRQQVRDERLPWYEPALGRGGGVRGLRPSFSHYRFELIFDEPSLDRVVLVRRLPVEPELKGLEDEACRVYEYLLMVPDAFASFCEREAALDAASIPAGGLDAAHEGAGEDDDSLVGGEAWIAPAPIASEVPTAPAPPPSLGTPSPTRIARLLQVEARGIPPRALIGREERLLKPAEIEAWEAAARSMGHADPAPLTPQVPTRDEPSGDARPAEPVAPAGGGGSAQGAAPVAGRASDPAPALERSASPAPADAAEEDAGASELGDGWGASPRGGALEAGGAAVPGGGALDAGGSAAPGGGRLDAGGGRPSTIRAPAAVRVAAEDRRSREALAFLSDDLPGEGGLSLSLAGFEASLGEPDGDDARFVDPFAVPLGAEEAEPAPAAAARVPRPGSAAASSAGSRGVEPATLRPERAPTPPAGPPAPPPAAALSPAPPPPATSGSPPPRAPSTYALDRWDVDGYGYALEEADGSDSPPTAILVGCPRQDVLQDCRRYVPDDLPPGGWNLDAVLARFVRDLARDLEDGHSQAAQPLPPGGQVYLLDPEHLLRLAGD